MKRYGSFMNKLKTSSPSIEPCGTAAIPFFNQPNFFVDLNFLSSVLDDDDDDDDDYDELFLLYG